MCPALCVSGPVLFLEYQVNPRTFSLRLSSRNWPRSPLAHAPAFLSVACLRAKRLGPQGLANYPTPGSSPSFSVTQDPQALPSPSACPCGLPPSLTTCLHIYPQRVWRPAGPLLTLTVQGVWGRERASRLPLGCLCAASLMSLLKYLLLLLFLVIAECQLFNEGHPDGEPVQHVHFHCLLLPGP